MDYRSWFGVDYDYTLVDSSGHEITKMVQKVQKALDEGKDVRIFTARLSNPKALREVREFCREQFGYELPITDKKDPGMVELWDDRSYNPILDGHMLAGLGKLAGVLKEKVGGMNKDGGQSKFGQAINRLKKRKQGKPSYNNETSMSKYNEF